MTLVPNNMMLIAIVPQALKDNVVDALITETAITGFSLSKIQGFSQAHSHYNVAEQVEGYRDFYRFEVLHQATESTLLVDILRAASPNKNIRYWILPLIESGIV